MYSQSNMCLRLQNPNSMISYSIRNCKPRLCTHNTLCIWNVCETNYYFNLVIKFFFLKDISLIRIMIVLSSFRICHNMKNNKTYLASRAKAITPAANGAAADVPVCEDMHVLLIFDVT